MNSGLAYLITAVYLILSDAFSDVNRQQRFLDKKYMRFFSPFFCILHTLITTNLRKSQQAAILVFKSLDDPMERKLILFDASEDVNWQQQHFFGKDPSQYVFFAIFWELFR